MVCEKCGGPVSIQVTMSIIGHGEMAHSVRKSDFRRPDVTIQGVLWETLSTVCKNEKCQHNTFGYGHYVSRLKKDLETLLSILRPTGLPIPKLASDEYRKNQGVVNAMDPPK